VIQAEVSPYRAAVAKQISDMVVNPREQNLSQVVLDETHGHGADISMEAVGPLFNECIENTRFGGRIILFGHDELARPQVQQAGNNAQGAADHRCIPGEVHLRAGAAAAGAEGAAHDLIVSHVNATRSDFRGAPPDEGGPGIEGRRRPEPLVGTNLPVFCHVSGRETSPPTTVRNY